MARARASALARAAAARPHSNASSSVTAAPGAATPAEREPATGPRSPRAEKLAAGKALAPEDDKCGPLDDGEDSEDEEWVEMVDPATKEWGGPTRGGTLPEPTRFGDWEKKGRVTDF